MVGLGSRRVSAKPSKDDENSFIDAVKEAFQLDPVKYGELNSILTAFKTHRIGRCTFNARMKELLKDHWELLLGFYTLLGLSKITIPPEPENPSSASGFLKKVEEAFRSEPAKYEQCISILTDYQSRRVDRSRTDSMLEELMEDHTDLLPGFSLFILDPFNARSYWGRVKEAFRDERVKYDQMLSIFHDFRAHRVDTNGLTTRVEELLKDHRDLLLDFNSFLPAGCKVTIPPEPAPEPDNNNKRERVESFVRKVKTRLESLDTHVADSFEEIMEMFVEGTNPTNEEYEEVVTLLQGHEDLLMELSEILNPPTDPSASTSTAES